MAAEALRPEAEEVAQPAAGAASCDAAVVAAVGLAAPELAEGPLPLEAGEKRRRTDAVRPAEDPRPDEHLGADVDGSARAIAVLSTAEEVGGADGPEAPPREAASSELSEEDFSRWVQRALSDGEGSVNSMDQEARLRCPDAFSSFTFTGPLRPAFVSPRRKPPEGCFLPDYALHPKGVARSEFLRSNTKTIPILEGQDLATMREACRLGREVLDAAARFLRPGVTGDEVDRVVWQACADRKLYPSPLNYFGFPKSVCVSANEVICHGIPDCRPLEEGDIVNLDISVCFQGFHSDLNETFFVGKCDEDSHTLVRTAYDALRAASALIRPGTMYRSLGAEIQAAAEVGGCAVVPNYCGHGVGKLFHGPPDVPHYKKNKAVGVMKPGHIFTVEPMLNFGRSGKDVTWPDGWTAATRNGQRSAQFEHTFLVTEDGFEVLTARPGTDCRSMPEYDPRLFQR